MDNSRSEKNEEKTLQPKEMSVKCSALNLPEDIIPLQTVKAAFRKAKELLNDKNGICKEASSHPRIFSVKSFSNGKKTAQSLAKGKNQNHLQCDCRIFAWCNFCCHTLATSEYGGFCLDYLNELKKKIFQGKPNLTAAIDKTRKISEKGIKKNGIAKASKRRTSRVTNQSLSPEKLLQSGKVRDATVPEILSETQQQPYILDTNVNISRNQEASLRTSSMVSIPSYNQFFSQIYSSGMPNPQTVTGNVPSTSCLHWHSGMSPHKYYLIEKPANVANWYGCNESFSLGYCQPPTNIIVKHSDRRITGKTQDGQLIYNADFTPITTL